MVAETYIVGVDGGATKTVALIGTTAGVMGRGEGGSSNYQNVGSVAASKAIRKAVVNAKKQAGLRGTMAEIAVIALAAVDSVEGIRVAKRFVRHANVARKNFVIHDSVAALYAATGGNPGIIVNSGTGCFAAGNNEAGEYVRVGGWGYLIDDKGSAFDVGMKAVTMGFRMADGRTPPTGLVRILKSRFGVRRFDEILDMVYSNRISVEEIAGLAPYVSKEASHDKVCRQILREAGASLAELACTAARRLNMRGRAFPVATVGGGFRSGRYLVEPFTSSVKQEYPQVRFLTLKDEPAKGAYRIAAQLSHHGSKAFSRDDRWLRKVVY